MQKTDMHFSPTQSVKADLAPDGHTRPQESRRPLHHHVTPNAILGVANFSPQEGKGREASRSTHKDPELLRSSSVQIPTSEN